ncbi:hypothetical protein [Ferrimonas balearica]|uniref:hypothetical protein n=1 Tax=Ferrimonas balearica TaxID=44012 RepID=UPI001F1EBF8F|nr:hypothetical protein [Ferrimonas balearica]MBY6093853.1 hypothetical protein [Ferrimonas balearica]
MNLNNFEHKFANRAIAALNRLGRDSDFAVLVELLEMAQTLTDEQLRTLEGVPLHRAQGRSQEISELLEIIRLAPSLFQRNQNRDG